MTGKSLGLILIRRTISRCNIDQYYICIRYLLVARIAKSTYVLCVAVVCILTICISDIEEATAATHLLTMGE